MFNARLLAKPEPNIASGPNSVPESYLEQSSAIELARRTLFVAPVFGVLSLIMLAGTPFLRDHGWFVGVEAALIIGLTVARVVYALGFEAQYGRCGKRAVFKLNAFTALQNLVLGSIAGVIVWRYWASQEVVLTITLCVGCVAAGTSALSVRRSTQALFLVSILIPLGVGVFLVGGAYKALLITGFLILMASLVQDGGVARWTHLQQLRDRYDAALARDWSPAGISAREDFIADINHELRTPVHSIIGMTTLLLDEKMGERPRELVRILRKSASTLMDLMENQLEEAMPSVQHLSSELGSTSLKRDVVEVLERFEKRAGERGVLFESHIEDLPATATFVGENYIKNVLVNLLNNAIEHCHDGKISVSARCKPQEGATLTVEFAVADTGDGIPSQQLHTVFEVPASPVAKRHGTKGGGLGLPMSKGLVELMGGSIRIESEVGQGTTVYFGIRVQLDDGQPWLSAPHGMSERVFDEFPRDLAKTHPMKILVVDDHELNRGVLCHLLKKMGYEAHEAEDGSEAVVALMKAQYDLVFMDLRMPNMNGLEATRWIRERNPEGHLCIVALTGEATEESQGRSRAAGMNGFLAKPVTADALASIVRHAAKRLPLKPDASEERAALCG
ncbi:MAG: response regulator [Xanthomonadales bacterium]|nr:response regulator [Xanthomonadales bacterium]